MKKLFYLLMMAFGATLFTACSDDDKNDTPINGLDIPKFENPVTPGQTVTIKGEGFNKSSEIWFRRIATRTTDNGDVKAKVTNVDANGITFLAPEVYGNQSVLLKQDGKEYKLGEMLFADQPEAPADVEILPKKIKRVLYYDNGQLSDSYEYDYDNDGRIISCKLLGDDIETYTYSENNITFKNEDYGEECEFVSENGRIKSYRYVNTKENESENGTVFYEGDYLNKVTGTYKEEDNEWTFTETYSFSNGNISKYRYEDDNGEYTNLVFTYGSRLNNLNIDLFRFLNNIDCYIVKAFQFDMTTGKRSHYLPSSMDVSYPEWNEDEDKIIGTISYTTKWKYEMDGEYITKITLENDKGYIEVYEIEYE